MLKYAIILIDGIQLRLGKEVTAASWEKNYARDTSVRVIRRYHRSLISLAEYSCQQVAIKIRNQDIATAGFFNK